MERDETCESGWKSPKERCIARDCVGQLSGLVGAHCEHGYSGIESMRLHSFPGLLPGAERDFTVAAVEEASESAGFYSNPNAYGSRQFSLPRESVLAADYQEHPRLLGPAPYFSALGTTYL